MKSKAISLGDRIRRLREEAGMSMAELASQIGISRQYVWMLETTPVVPSWEIVQKIADTFGVSTESLR